MSNASKQKRIGFREPRNSILLLLNKSHQFYKTIKHAGEGYCSKNAFPFLLMMMYLGRAFTSS